MLGQLLPRGGGDPIPLLKPKLLIGRRDHCDIVLNFPNVSSQHCELDFQDGYWAVRDLGSRNGIKVNGDRCERKWLMPGDVVSVAKHHFEISYVPKGSAPPPEEEEEDFLSTSLMEKAGLSKERRPPRSRPELPAKDARPDDEPNPEEDIAMKWLTGED